MTGGTAITRPQPDAVELSSSEVSNLLQVDRDNIVHSWIAQREYVPKLITGAMGSYLWDVTGRRYLDFTSEAWYANIGHGNPRVAQAVAAQVARLASIYRYGTEPKLRLAQKLLSLLPGTYERIFFGCNGSDAVELALKIARLVTRRQSVISFYGEYHGASMGAASVTGIPTWRSRTGQPVPGTIFVPAPYHRDRAPGSGDSQEEIEADTLSYLRRTIEQAGPDSIAAVIGEPFVTAGPAVFPTRSYWKKVRAICDEYGLLLISDEIVTGFGRTGHWFARDYYDYEPDILCFGKGLTSGYLPLSAAVFTGEVASRFADETLPHGLTYAGHPVCCAAAIANLEVIDENDLVSKAAAAGIYLAKALNVLRSSHEVVSRAQSLGLFAVIELDTRKSRSDPADLGPEVMRLSEERGVIVRGAEDRVSFAPPLTVTPEEVDFGLAALAEALRAVTRG
jgi:taurine--2-oxoglutarate transaminase